MSTMLINREDRTREVLLGVRHVLTERDMLSSHDRVDLFVERTVVEMTYKMMLLLTMKSPHIGLEEETLP